MTSSKSENTCAERTPVSNLSARLGMAERSLRMALMQQLIILERPVTQQELSRVPQLENLDLERTLSTLFEKKVAAADHDGAISSVYPVSARPTPHRVTLDDGQSFHAMCAVDALGSCFTFRQGVQISSQCSQCREPVRVTLQGDALLNYHPRQLHVLHVDLEQFDDWAGNC